MCDCFHMMLPTWSEAPGSASGQQLQPEEPDAETAEDQSVTEGSVDEIIRPRPQGSSPVYEYVTEGAGFGLPSTQEATEGTLKTKVEAGASGYIVTGGGDQGIFVKQVLKESSAAKLFSLREGDQLLSTTIFFDDIKYEDALKILQYSEPYKVQFTVRRQLPAREDEEGASGGAPRGSRGSKKQDQDIAEGRTETPTETLQEDGDQERLISKPREGRGRQPQRERLSWPKFQALKSKRGPGPRRSHSSSEASERGDVPDLSPTSTDTEAQLPEAGPGRQRKKSFPNLRFRVGSGKGLSGRGAHGGTVQAGVLVETGPRDSGREASRAAAHGGREDRTAGVPEAAEPPTEPGLPTEGAPGEGAGPAPRPRRKTKEAKDRGETVPQGNAGLGPAPGQSREGAGEGTQALEAGIARLSLQDSADQGIHQNHQPEFHVRIPTLKTPKFGLYKEKVLEKEGAATALQQGPRQRRVSAEGTEAKGEDAGEAEKHRPRQPPVHPPAQEGGATEEDAAQKRDEDSKGGGPHTDEKEGKMKMLRFKLPSFGWSPAKEAKGDKATQLQETEKEKESSITVETLETDVKGQGGLERDGKFQMPRFKMPSFRVSAPSKSVQAAVEVSVPKAQAEVTLTSVQADVKTSDLRIEQLSTELEVKAAEVGVKLPEGHHPEAEPKEAVAGIGLKGHLPTVQMPSIKAPQVDIKGPKLDLKDAKGDVKVPDVEVSLPSVEVDSQAEGIMLAGDMSLGDKEVAARDSKFKMPKFKMPSFGVSASSKSVEASLDGSGPKAQAEVTRPSVQADVKTSDFSIELPSSKLEVKAAEVGLKQPEDHLPEVEPTETAAVIGLKGHLSKVQMPSIKVPKVDIKAPQVDIKGPKLDLKDAKGEVTTPDMQVSLPSVEVDTQAAGTKLVGDVSLGDKEVATRDSKFKMPKFKMPSFGVSAPSKSVQAAMEVSVPKAQAEVTLPSVQADVKTSDISTELPSTELDVKAAEVGVKLPEGHPPEAEIKEAVAGIGLKGHLPKVQMPSITVPKVDLKGPKLDRQDAKGEVTTPNVEVLLPSVEVDTQAAGTKLESDVSLGDKEVATRDSKFKMPKFKMPSFGVSAPSKSVEAALEESVPNVQAQVTLSSVQADVKTSALSIELPSTELEVKGAKVGVKLPEGHLLRAGPREVALGIALKGHLPKLEKPSIKVPKVDIEGPKLDLKDAKGEVLTKYQVTLPGAAVSPGLPLEAAPCSQNDAYLPSSESSASLPTQERVAASQTDSPAGPVDPMFLASYGRVSFPKFHPPKFGFSVPEAADAEVEAGAGGCAPSLSTTGPARGLDSTAVPRSAWPSAVAAGESPAKDTERGGKDSPLKMPWIKLPSFSWSPEKGAVPPEDPECNLDDAEIGVAVDTGLKGVPPGCPVSAVEVAVDALPEKDGEESGVGSPGCAVLEHAPLTGLTPEGGPGLPRGDPAAPRSRPPAGGGAPEGADVDPHLPQAHTPLLDFVRPDLRPSKAKVGGSSSAGGPPSPGHSSQGHGLRDGPASQPLGEAMAPSVGDPQQPSCSPADVDAPAVESAASQGGWFRMPALRLPSLRRPARERGAAGARGAPVPAPAASTLREGESPAPVRGQGVPGSEVEEAMSLQPPEAGADEAAAELASYADADVLKRGPGDKRSELHLSPAGAPAAGLSPSEARVRPGEGSLPLQMPSSRLSGTQAPPAGPAGPGLAAGQGRAEEWPSQPEGPIKLKASRTAGPSQVSVVNMGQPWEGSVVTVRLPRLSVPRFAFPDPSSEADVFIPAVTEVQCPGSSLAHALHEGSPGVWGASILRAGAGTPEGQPVALGFSPEASPISEVRVHVQRAQGEGPEVAVHSRATAELADLSGPEAISTQVVRQLEIPASEIQTASYGFSLLKVKVPEPRTRVSVRDSRLRDGLQEASQQAAPGAEPASGGPQPDTAGPSEVISPSVDVPGQPTFTPKVHSGRQGADSCCDKAEGAEVLAFPPKEAGGEAATSRAEEGSAPGEKPGGRRSGLFRFWLPNIGFSSSAEEPRADSKGEARAAAALQTQPGARPEAELPRKPQRAGWFRFPTLGLSSSPTKKSESSEDEAALAEQDAQEQAATFFDAPESFSPEGEGAGGPAETAGARAMATSTARTGLVLLEQDPEGGMHLHPGPPQSEDRQTDERRPCEAPTVRTRMSTLIHSTESEAEVPESGGAPPSHSPPEVGPQTRRPPRASAAEAAPGRPTRPQPHAGSCAPDGLG
ncbi:protein AHNAK2 isoform X2 [Sagmatias obliquidens]|uniref:protein AHNAK2 isoform X2 n=1 Tax=Sagmatias obliquidens TaxID=3371155 RepID=UPI000F442008|nr:protein AHNAK2-like isoform X2 [Lagenorhynchus obliquidens]